MLAWDAPPAGSALAKFWPVLDAATRRRRSRRVPASAIGAAGALPAPPAGDVVAARRATRRAGWRIAACSRADTLPFDWAREAARRVGTVAHRLLAQIARESASRRGCAARGVARTAASCRARGRGRRRSGARRGGGGRDRLPSSAMLADPRGRWLFDPAHAEALSEWALGGWDGSAVTHVARRPHLRRRRRALDRRFQDRHATKARDRDAFLDREVGALSRRSSSATRASCARSIARPIRLALYYPLLRRLARMGVSNAGTQAKLFETRWKSSLLKSARRFASPRAAPCVRFYRGLPPAADAPVALDDRQFRRRPSRPPGDARRGSSKPRRTCACRRRC